MTLASAAPISVPATPKNEATTAEDTAANALAATCAVLSAAFFGSSGEGEGRTAVSVCGEGISLQATRTAWSSPVPGPAQRRADLRKPSVVIPATSGDGLLLGGDRGVPLALGGLPAVLGVAAPPVAGDRGELARQAVGLAQVPAQLADGAGLAVHEQVAGALGQGGAPDGGDEGLAGGAVAAVHPDQLDAVPAVQLGLLLLRAGDLDEGEHAGAGGQPVQGRADCRQRALVAGEQVPVGV